MRITKDQLVAGYPVIQVRSFIRRYRLGTFVARAAEHAMKLSASEAEDFLGELVNLGYLEQAYPIFAENIVAYEVTQQGQALANASGSKPISRETADRALREFMERAQTINESREYAYQIESVVLFGDLEPLPRVVLAYLSRGPSKWQGGVRSVDDGGWPILRGGDRS
jgi:hypothetical protein